MATQLQMRSGTTLQNDIFTGAPGEITYDTEKKNLRIHDGETVGGMEIASAGAADYVVEWQTPTEANGYTWYRKYKSGWVEQGGYKEISTGSSATVPLPITMADTNYSAQMTPAANATGTSPRFSIIKANLTTTTVTLNWYSYNDGQAKAYWQVSGMAA